MAYQREKIEQFEQALQTLEDILTHEKNDIVRDATIQRFEYTVEAFWKALKTVLRESLGIDAASPKAVLRSAGGADICKEEEVSLALTMIDDRNETSHLYTRALAEKLFEKIPRYTKLLRLLCDRMKSTSV